MASNKNTNVTNNADLETGGFRTATFGFDKNDVTKYITSLRKKMKSMEEEFELKLAQAQDNPVTSGNALTHEREVIRAEMEKQWNDRMFERNSVIQDQKEKINELEIQLSEKNEMIQSLKEQLAAATSSGGSGASPSSSAKAAEAYMQFTAELRSISESAQRTLTSIEEVWSGEFGALAAGHYTAPAMPDSQFSMPVNAAPETAAEVNEPFNWAEETKKPADINNDFGFGSLVADDDEYELLSGLISDTDDNDEMKAPETVPAPAPAPKPAPAPVKTEFSDDFASLLAESDTDFASNESNLFDVTPASPLKSNDFDDDLLSDIVVAPSEEHNGEDLGNMLKEKEQSEFDAFKELFVTEGNANNDDGFIDLEITPYEQTEYKPGIGTEFDLKADDGADVSGLDDFVISVSDEHKATEVKAAPEPAAKKEEDLFDFSFLAANDDDEDDMSSDSSFSGF